MNTLAYQISADNRQALRSDNRRDVLSSILNIAGVSDVLVIPGAKRSGIAERDKVFVVLATHDTERDYRVVSLLCQIETVDMDLVPVQAMGMIPEQAVSLRDHR